MAKTPTHTQWSKVKKDNGADNLLRDKWHIGKHLDSYHKAKAKEKLKRFLVAEELERKFKDYKAALKKKDTENTCGAVYTFIDDAVNHLKAKLTKFNSSTVGKEIKKLKDKRAEEDQQKLRALEEALPISFD